MHAGTRLSLIALVWLLSLASAMGQTISADRASIGGTKVRPDSDTTLRVQGLATSGGTDLVFLDAEGDARRRVLVAGDVPATFTQRNVAEAISQAWSFNAGLTVGGNLTISGTARRILGDFSDATLQNRVMFQSSVTNGATGVYAMPNGTSTAAAIGAFNRSDPTNSGFMQFSATNTEVTLRSTATGTGTFLPMTFHTNGAEQLRIGTDGDTVPGTSSLQSLGKSTQMWSSVYTRELRALTLVAQDVVSTIGGWLYVGATTKLLADVTVGAGRIVVEHNEAAVGDRFYLSARLQAEIMVVTAGPVSCASNPANCGGVATGYYYDVTRGDASTGADAWLKGDAVMNTGVIGDCFIEQYAFTSLGSGTAVGPTITGNCRTANSGYSWAPRWAIGQLNGIYGYSSSEFGFAAGDPAGRNITADATNGIRMRSGTTNRLVLDASYLRFYGTNGVQIGYIGGTGTAPDIVLGNSAAAGTPYLALTSTTLSFCAAGTACPLQLNGTNGDITSTGNILLSTGGNIKSTGNFEITQANGIKIESSSTGIGGGGDAAKRLWFPGGGSIYQYSDDVIVSAITASSGSPTISLYAQRGACGTGITCFGYLDVIPSTATATTATQFVLNGSQTTGVGEAYYEVLRGDSAGSLRLGTSSIYLGAIHWNGPQTGVAGYPMIWDGPTNQLVAKSDGRNANCVNTATLVIEYGIIVDCY